MFVLLSLAAGCSSAPEEATWIEGVYFRWSGANHRLSYAHFRPGDEGGLEASLIGGTSTTKQEVPPLGDTCDEDACTEFRITDESNIRVSWASVTTSEVALEVARAELLTGEGGATTTVSVPLPGRVVDVTAMIRGFTLDSNHPLSGDPACYRPEYGWHPRRIQFSIEDVVRTRTGADVTVGATFAAGSTQDEQRACVDEVYERAQVPVVLDVLVIGDGMDVEEQTVTASADYKFSGNQFNPEPQEEVAATALAFELEGRALGWTSIDYSFNPGDAGQRGAYLRSWGFEAGADGVSGVATNFSRGTQLHGMSYAFEGTVQAVDLGADVQRGVVEATMQATLNADERPVVETFPLE